jgi:hypothetical protein
MVFGLPTGKQSVGALRFGRKEQQKKDRRCGPG